MFRIFTTSITFFFAVGSAVFADDKQLLGKIDFPTSGSAEAHPHFIEGLLYMHNFEYKEAGAAFKKAQELDKNFAMAYWGEALAYTHPLWFQQSRQTAVDCLNRLGRTPEARQEKAGTQREKDFLWTIEILYGTVDETKRLPKDDRDDAYREAMRALHEKYPDDDEATTLYGLSILGTSHDGRDYTTYMQAAATLTKVWDKNRMHPGAAHYLIHSYDDPVHAPLGLPMARAYTDIAPSAAHAQHMVSHIFVALGMWDDVVKSNTRAIEVENESSERDQASGHYPHWLLYGTLQRGEFKKAEALMAKAVDRIKNDPKGGEVSYFGSMVARYVLDTEDWDYVDNLGVNIENKKNGSRNWNFTKAFSAAMRGQLPEAKAHFERMKISSTAKRATAPAITEVMTKELTALILLKEGKADEAVALMQEAAEQEISIPMSFGPPSVEKPSYELLGETLLELGRHDEAVAAFKKQLARTPRRTQVLEGLADASEALGKTAAEQGYRDTLTAIRHTADSI